MAYDVVIKDGLIVEELGLDDGVTALTQLGILVKATPTPFEAPVFPG